MKILTYNIRFVLDRWFERKAYLFSEIKSTEADIIGLQECNNGAYFYGQDRDIKKELENSKTKKKYMIFNAPCVPSYIGSYIAHNILINNPITRFFMKGIVDFFALLNEHYFEAIFGKYASLLFRSQIIGSICYFLFGSGFVFGNCMIINKDFIIQKNQKHLALGGKWRVASKKRCIINNRNIIICNTHLNETPQCEITKIDELKKGRLNQVELLLEWLVDNNDDEQIDGIILMGDFNAEEDEPIHKILKQDYGFINVYESYHKVNPKTTFHQNHECLTKDIGEEGCLDYIYIKGNCFEKINNVSLVGTKPLMEDSTVFASDHFGILADITII